MDLRRLEVFCKLMETRSFSKTGKELNLTQPTVSGHIKSLEERIGLTLFDRHKRSVKPTNAAKVLLEYANKMLSLREEAGYALERFQGRIRGKLKLGGSTIPGTYVLPVVMGGFHGIYQETYLQLTQGDTRNIIERVAKGDIEVGIVGAELPVDGLVFEPVLKDEMVLAVPVEADWPGTRKNSKTISIKDLSSMPFIIREEGSGTKTEMLKAMAVGGMTENDLHVVAEMDGTEPVRQAVKAGLGVSVLSRVAVADSVKVGLMRALQVRELDFRRNFFLVTNTKRTPSPVAAAFVDYIRKQKHSLTRMLGE